MSFDEDTAQGSATSPARPRKLVAGLLHSPSPPGLQDLATDEARNLFEAVGASSALTYHAEGRCSQVYQVDLIKFLNGAPTSADDPDPSRRSSPTDVQTRTVKLVESHGGAPGRLCIKRVTTEDQCRPHSVELEVELLEQLSHPNIVALLAVVQDTSDPFGTILDLCMPLFPACLSDLLDEPSFTPDPLVSTSAAVQRPALQFQHLWSGTGTKSFASFVTSFATQLFSALAYLHDEKQIAHRDIKPCNILLSHEGRLKLIDFGTALNLSSSSHQASTKESREGSSGSGTIFQVGTGSFRAPELLFAPTNGYDAFKIDIWAAGVTLAHFFTALEKVDDGRQRTSLQVAEAHEEGHVERRVEVILAERIADDRPSWQKALWDDADGPFPTDPYASATAPANASARWSLPSSPAESSFGSSYGSNPDTDHRTRTSPTGHLRTSLFNGSLGEIALAGSIFSLLGLPTTIEQWPEAAHFLPPLHRLHFAAPATPKRFDELLETRLVHLRPALEAADDDALERFMRSNMLAMLSLSARQRPSARQLLDALR